MKYALRERKGDIVSDLLSYRGIDAGAREAFLAPNYDLHTHDPFLMKDMDKAVERIYKAIKNNEKIIVFSDYDADGIPGAVVMHDALKKVGFDHFEIYIPHRHDEGFGLSKRAVDIFKEKGAKVLVTIDCGISDIDEVAYAVAAGMDVIVTDHHIPHADLPLAFAILNPKVTDCAYPEKMLCGSGVIFKFVQAFFKKYGAEFGVKTGWEKWFLDMVGIATLSDMVPLTGENRVFAYYGLAVLKKTARPGLSKLFSKLRVKREHITEDDVGFTITPRINAASRMGEPSAAFNLLSTSDEALAGAYADSLEHVNNERKGTVAALVKEIKKILSERDMTDKKVIVLGNPSWRPSLLGLAANSFADEYHKPVFLWGRDGENVFKGSCRSGKSASVRKIMDGAKECFSEYGGHDLAGGFGVKNEYIHTLEQELEKAAVAAGENVVEVTEYADAAISLEDVSWNLYKDLEKLSPFGMANPKPLFIIQNARIETVKSFGKEKNHTEILFRDTNGRAISAIQFFSPTSALPSHAVPQATINFAAHLEKSTFKNYPELRLRIVDIL